MAVKKRSMARKSAVKREKRAGVRAAAGQRPPAEKDNGITYPINGPETFRPRQLLCNCPLPIL